MFPVKNYLSIPGHLHSKTYFSGTSSCFLCISKSVTRYWKKRYNDQDSYHLHSVKHVHVIYTERASEQHVAFFFFYRVSKPQAQKRNAPVIIIARDRGHSQRNVLQSAMTVRCFNKNGLLITNIDGSLLTIPYQRISIDSSLLTVLWHVLLKSLYIFYHCQHDVSSGTFGDKDKPLRELTTIHIVQQYSFIQTDIQVTLRFYHCIC